MVQTASTEDYAVRLGLSHLPGASHQNVPARSARAGSLFRRANGTVRPPRRPALLEGRRAMGERRPPCATPHGTHPGVPKATPSGNRRGEGDGAARGLSPTCPPRRRSRRLGTERPAELTPADLVARVGATPRWCWGHDRPLQDERARALGRGLLLTTHFSGADEAQGGVFDGRSVGRGAVGGLTTSRTHVYLSCRCSWRLDRKDEWRRRSAAHNVRVCVAAELGATGLSLLV